MKLKIGYLFFLFLLIAAAKATGEECQVIKMNDNGTYEVKIGGSSFKALSDQQMTDLLLMEPELVTAQSSTRIPTEKIKSLETIIGEMEKRIKERDELLKKNKDYIEKLEAMNKVGEELVKKCCGRNRVTLTGGIGLTTEADPAVLIGVGYNDFRLWGMFEKDVKAGIVGMDWQVFSW